jgi:Spx/MgsR family transcriptional regulator
MNTVLHGIKKCDTVKKARSWLKLQQIEYTFHDFRVDGLTKNMLEDFLKHVEWETLLNKRGTTWRKLPDKQKHDVNKKKALELMYQNPTLIKRPVLAYGMKYFVGFSETDYEKIFNPD